MQVKAELTIMSPEQLSTFHQRLITLQVRQRRSAVSGATTTMEKAPPSTSRVFNKREMLAPILCFLCGFVSVVIGTLLNRLWGVEIAALVASNNVNAPTALTPIESGMMTISIVLILALGSALLAGMRTLSHVLFLSCGLFFGQGIAPEFAEMVRTGVGAPLDRNDLAKMDRTSRGHRKSNSSVTFHGLERRPLPSIDN